MALKGAVCGYQMPKDVTKHSYLMRESIRCSSKNANLNIWTNSIYNFSEKSCHKRMALNSTVWTNQVIRIRPEQLFTLLTDLKIQKWDTSTRSQSQLITCTLGQDPSVLFVQGSAVKSAINKYAKTFCMCFFVWKTYRPRLTSGFGFKLN